MSKEGRDVARYFCDTFELKLTQKQFLIQVGIANSLLKAGYTEYDLTNIVQYLKEHPPAKGLSSLAYIQYVGNDILAKQKVQQYKQVESFFESSEPIKDNEDNLAKFNMQKKTNQKGMVNF
jgi:hypothetical protein